MPTTEPTSSHNSTKRQITVDGIRFSLDTGKPVAQPQPQEPVKPPRNSLLNRIKSPKHRAHVPEKPLPKAIQITAHHQAIIHPDPKLRQAELIHPHHVSHPSLPLPTHRLHQPAEYRTIWRTIIQPTLLNPPDSRAVKAGIIATLLSPLVWLLAALPIFFILSVDVPEQPIGKLYQVSVNLFNRINPNLILLTLGIGLLSSCLVWLLRHLLLLVSYGIHIRRIDHRLASGRQLLWLAGSKIGRFITLAITDFILHLSIFIGGGYLIAKIIAAHGPLESMLINLVVLVIGIAIWLLATERPLSRVMLATTDQPLSGLVTKSLGMIIFSRGRALASGLVWLLVAGIHAAALFGVVWASSAYGLLQVTSVIGRIVLLILSTSIIVLVASIFTIWSHDFWPHVYHDLAHRSHRHDISSLITGSRLTKSRRRIILTLGGLALSSLILIALGMWFIGPPIIRGSEQLKMRIPTSLEAVLPDKTINP